MVGYAIPSLLYYYQELMSALRAAIEVGGLAKFTAGFLAEQGAGDLEPI